MNKLLLASILIPSPIATTTLPHNIVEPSAIVQVICISRTQISAGSAFRIGATGLMASVNHVTSSGDCFVGTKRITVSYKSPDKDFSLFQGDPGPFLKVDCGGFVKGKKYLATGYARGLDHLTTIELTGTGQMSGQFSTLWGVFTLIPGQSGGPSIDEDTGRAVGTNNVYNMESGMSGSVAFRDTPLCRKAA